MLKKEHLTIEGLHKIVSLKTSMNLGISPKLKSAFPDVIPVPRPIVAAKNDSKKFIDRNWLAGFTSAEGCFYIDIFKDKTITGYTVKLVFQITQHSRDEKLIQSFITYFECGRVYQKGGCAKELKVTKLSDIVEKIIPFFQQHKIEGWKHKDFEDFCKVVEMMKEKKHLTKEGFEEIKKIKAGMNRGRKFNSHEW